MQLSLLVILLTFIATTLFIIALIQMFLGPRLALAARLKLFTSLPVIVTEPMENEPGPRRGFFNPRRWMQQMSSIFASSSHTKYIQRELIRADIPLRGEEFIFLSLFGIVVIILATCLLTRNLALIITAALTAMSAPFFWIHMAKSRRIQRFNNQMGDALSILSNSLRAGHSFLQAAELVSQEMRPPLGDEFSLLIREINLGVNTEEALIHLGERVASTDLDLLITAVLIQRQIGGNLAEVIDNISQTIRERIRIQGEIKTLTAQGRISGLVIGLLPPGVILFLLIINPGYITLLFTHPLGQMMIGAAIVSQIIGLIIIRRIINIEV